MRIYLINPPADNGVKQVREGRCMQRAGAWTSIWPPISLALTAGLLRKNGFKVKISDCIIEDMGFEELSKLAKEFKPDMAIINIATPSLESDLSTVTYLKKAVPFIKTAVIGIHGTGIPKSCFEIQKDLDFIIRGEPEWISLDLAKTLEKNGNLAKVQGISWQKNGKIINNTLRPFNSNLDELPFPAWDLIKREKYIMPFTTRPFLLIATGRGCPYLCTFCADKAYYGTKLRLRSPVKLVDELEWAGKEFGVYDFLFWSESFTLNKNFTNEVCDEILRRGLKIKWVCNSRVDNVDLPLLQKIKEAGCWNIGFGIESGVQTVLDSVKKGIKVEQTVKAIELSKKAELLVTAHVVLGFPADTKETLRQTIDFIKSMDLDFAQFYCAVPFPGSQLYNEAISSGWINTRDWRMFEQNFSVMDMPNLKAKEVMEWRNRAYREFYFRPKIIFKTISRIRSFGELARFFTVVFDFLNWIR